MKKIENRKIKKKLKKGRKEGKKKKEINKLFTINKKIKR